MRFKPEDTPKTHLAQANEALKALAPNVIAEDRKAAPASEPTVVQYLKGEGTVLTTALKLLKFFQKRIERRADQLRNSAAGSAAA